MSTAGATAASTGTVFRGARTTTIRRRRSRGFCWNRRFWSMVKGVVLALGRIEQRAVIEIGPAALMDRVHAMAGQERRERARQIAIEQDPHGAAGATRPA